MTSEVKVDEMNAISEEDDGKEGNGEVAFTIGGGDEAAKAEQPENGKSPEKTEKKDDADGIHGGWTFQHMHYV